MAKIIDITNQRFGRLVVLYRIENNSNGTAQWLCKCDCGNQKAILGINLRGGTVSCGCYRKELDILGINTTHNMSNSITYKSWTGIRYRCYNKNCHNYHLYGGKGIKVCDRWLNSFQNFYDDMGQRPSKYYSIDRINNNKNYEPNNCRWATQKEQSRNTSQNKIIQLNNYKLTLSEWEEMLGINRRTIMQRLDKGWSVERTLTTPVRKCRNYIIT